MNWKCFGNFVNRLEGHPSANEKGFLLEVSCKSEIMLNYNDSMDVSCMSKIACVV